ncbi:hypothetical protein GQX74_005161 [Glossina fuscipes]|nr:hypothetical protein GQX74_005161 [Glossina fuscipes]
MNVWELISDIYWSDGLSIPEYHRYNRWLSHTTIYVHEHYLAVNANQNVYGGHCVLPKVLSNQPTAYFMVHTYGFDDIYTSTAACYAVALLKYSQDTTSMNIGRSSTHLNHFQKLCGRLEHNILSLVKWSK